ncbi:hypothetical protein MTZ49_07215 [Entomomonas sp. E2T0]|uniref:hypothetical protein n=1 Tax=Entomomonas sp. E2T0 TaxID=2930213 RepID=UPI0022281EBC|nr:hypothetical protein [Entomomonas sp. E2T0]UYZ85328.1 hypothetical protein MTZ49_07215 [Entomomonas sp. E2T0]
MERVINWSLGSNNVTAIERLPDGFVRSIVNLDAGDLLSLRTGFEKVLAGQNIRALFSIGNDLIIVDSDQLICFDTLTGTSDTLINVPENGTVAGTLFNEQLYLIIANQSYRIKGRVVKQWIIANPKVNLSIGKGNLQGGRYKLAVTSNGEEGEESGADIYFIDVPDNSSIQINSNIRSNVYATEQNSEILYYQGLADDSYTILNIESDTKRLATGNMYPFPYVTNLVNYHGVIIGSIDNYLYFSAPFMPHLIRAERGFLQYPAPISIIAPVADGIYVVADKTYFIANLENDQINQVKVSDTDAIKGTYTPLPDGRAAWFCRYGQVIAGMSGELATPNKGIYAPEVKQTGAAGYLEHNGRQLIVNSLDKNSHANNNLAIGDYWEIEIDGEVCTC